ncbi:hypothetical protein [Infirmifilum sp.]|uniref:hypothetical protein n=1 Tax=Infirmifilum sp. TaxID=2856575 RepID=UPI003D0E3C9B
MTSDALRFFKYERLQEPYLLFYMRRRYVSPRTGLVRAGPYDAENHRSDDIYVGLIVVPAIADAAKKFVQHLGKGHGFYKGFKSVFKANSLIFSDEYVKTVKGSSDNILQYIEDAYFELAEKLPDKSTIIIIADDEVIERNYSRVKNLRFRYTKKKIRLQLVKRSTLERVLSDATALDFTLLNVATAIYAKAEGTPWILERQLIPAGIFIGIAFTRPRVVSSSSRAKEIFYYGIMTVYNKSGEYISWSASSIRIEISAGNGLRGTKGLYIPKGDMIKMLNQIIDDRKFPIVIIHKSSRFHIDEIEAARHVLGGKNIGYALIHIESSNPYRGYGEEQHDATVLRGDLVLDGELSNRAILFTTGYTQSDDRGIRRRGKPGTPKPLELEVGENTTPYSVRDFAGQILGLTKLDWNTTDIEVKMPITIEYARRVAALVQHSQHNPPTIMDVRDLM